MADWVELRVHGVSGTPPESMLGSAHVVQIAGDERSRVFRPTDAQNRDVWPADHHVVEAFHWGRWTSGSWTQALWLLLIPFGMVNASQFMLPEPRNTPARLLHALCGAVLRLLGLVLTALITVGAAVVVMDLVTWQFLARRVIPISDAWLLAGALAVTTLLVFLVSWLGQTHRGARFRFSQSEVRPADGTLPGLGDARFFDGDPDNPTLRALHRAAATLLLAWLALSVAASADVGWAETARLWALGLLGVTSVVAFLLGDPEETVSQATVKFWHGWAEADEMQPEGRLARVPFNIRRLGVSYAAAWALLLSAVVLLGLGMVGFFQAHPPGGRLFGLASVDMHLPAIDETAAAVGIGGTGVVVALFACVALLAAATASDNTPRLAGVALKPFRRFAWGMTPALASAVGFFIGIGLTAGLSLTVQGALNRLRDDTADRLEQVVVGAAENLQERLPDQFSGVVPADEAGEFVADVWPNSVPVVEAPDVLQRVSYAWGLTAGLILLLVLFVWGWKTVRGSTFRSRARRMMRFGVDPEPRLPDRWLRKVATAMELARLKKRRWLVSVFWLFAVAGLVFSLAATFGYAATSDWVAEHVPWLLGLGSLRWWPLLTGVTTSPGEPVEWPDIVIGIGQATLLGLAGGAVLLARGAIRAEGSRRALNVVWDVIAFWPRVTHPFVPSPYAQSVVPALVRRICWHLGIADPLRDVMDEKTPDGRTLAPPPLNPEPVQTVVLAAHSQGSLISLAAILWLPPEVRTRVRWLTFGSQLRQAFPRAFPHYVRVESLREAQLVHRWLNLYRDTDHIAGPVTSWDHTWGEGKLYSNRLELLGGQGEDHVDAATGRRECGREWRLLDPVPGDLALQRRPAALLRKHSDYWLDPDWGPALDDVLGWNPPDGPPGQAAVGRSVPDQQRDGQPAEQRVDGDPRDVRDDAPAGQ